MGIHAPYLLTLLTETCNEVGELKIKGSVRMEGEEVNSANNIPVLWACFVQMYLYDREQ